jgi:hypothetical protein
MYYGTHVYIALHLESANTKSQKGVFRRDLKEFRWVQDVSLDGSWFQSIGAATENAL